MTNSILTFGEFLLEFYRYKSNKVSKSTLRNIGIVIRCHVPEWLENKPLKEITALDIETAVYEVGTSRMRVCVHQVFNEALERAVWQDYIIRNPMWKVKKPKLKGKKGKALTASERKRLFENVDNPILNLLFRFYIYTGCRRSEALSITWADVDIEDLRLTIRGTKTEQSNRDIPISRPLLEILKELELYSDGINLFDYSPDYVSKQFKKYCPQHKLHDLRHTFATICLEKGISMKLVSKWLGHTTVAITLNIYSSVFTDYERREADKL